MTPQTATNTVIRDIVIVISALVLIFSIALYFPLLGFFTAILIPLPVLFYRLKLGRNMGALIMVGGFGIIASLTGGISIDILFFATLFLIGFFLGENNEMQHSIEKTAIYTCLSTLGICLGLLFLYSSFKGQGIILMVSEYVGQIINMTLKLYAGMGVPQENIDIISNSLENIKYVIVRIMPALIVMMLMFVTWINILLIRAILKKKKISLSKLEMLNRWRAPEQIVWVVIVFGLLMLIPNQMIRITGLNFIIMMIPVYFFQGIAIVSFFLEKKKFPFDAEIHYLQYHCHSAIIYLSCCGLRIL